MLEILFKLLDSIYLILWRIPLKVLDRKGVFNTIQITVSAGLTDYVDPPRILGAKKRLTPVIEIIEALDRAGKDKRIRSAVVRIKSASSPAAADEIRAAIARFRASGKKVYAYFESAAPLAFYIACAADEILAPPSASLFVFGVHAEVTFMREALDKLGVAPEFEAMGEYKNFANTFTEKGFTDAHRESVESLLDEVHNTFIDAAAVGRKISPEKARELIESGPWGAAEAVEAGLIDRTCYGDEIKKLLKENYKGRVRLISSSDFLARKFRERTIAEAWRSNPRIAVVTLSGSIKSGKSVYSAGGDGAIGSESAAKILNEIRSDSKIKGVILRVNSRGGSGLASDIIWRAATRLAEKKPLVVSFSDVAASGGYYLSVPGVEIFAQPLTLTGSIGVFAGKFSLGALYRKIGFSVEEIKRGANSGIFSSSRKFEKSEREKLRDEIERFYRLFLDRVGTGRSMEIEKVDAVARGRVWSGRQAAENGLVDKIGGFYEAARSLCQRLGIDPESDLEIEVYPRFPRIMLPGKSLGSMLSALTSINDTDASVADDLVALARFADETVIAYEPRNIRFK